MKRLTKRFLPLLFVLALGTAASAFSLLGPFKADAGPPNNWQAAGFGGRPRGIGYSLDFDIGGPMFPLEAYRWNVPIITYGFDESFLRYFGWAGVAAVSNAFQILMDLPPFTTMSRDLSEFPYDNRQAIHYDPQLQTLGLLDLKSEALVRLVEELGLANPQRFVWGLRARTTFGTPPPGVTNYSTIMLNFDPATVQPSRYVNGVLYHYQIFDALGRIGAEWASAVEFFQNDPFYLPYSAVAGAGDNSDLELGDSTTSSILAALGAGEYFSGLTRDDIAGLRYIYGTNNMVTELLLTNTLAATITGALVASNRPSPWTPFFNNTNVFIGTTNALFTTNATGTNLTVQGIRPGINKLIFQRVNFDSLLGQILSPLTNKYTDTYITNGRPVIQPLERVSTLPDILFMVQDVGIDIDGVPLLTSRTGTAAWQNNDLINGYSDLGGPGVITPPVQITFTDVLPYFLNEQPFFIDDITAGPGFIWGSFDGSTNAPAIFPNYLNITLQDLQNAVLGGP